MNNKTEFKFGDYAIIEQKRHGAPNEMFVHKVIDQLRSNTWVDVPVQSPATETMHDEMEDVCLCICCGVDETEVRKYRVKDMRRRSPVSAVTDEKKGSTITLQAVNELIQSLESAGELSIKETKVMALVKAFKQLAAENVAMRKTLGEVVYSSEEVEHDGCLTFVVNPDYVHDAADLLDGETPATDRIVAGIKADGVDIIRNALIKFVEDEVGPNDVVPGLIRGAEICVSVADSLREGAK
ncbi:hypothetical protein PTQ46_03475 [Klebsiella michiganensis]|nr:hypothetical protein [Klebsiella michiganensis]MDS7839277.1 hypothetical protein [Klebsiella michiganensis]MEB6467692.1 hypothetical protein [Klebsiella michiganensis]